MSRISNQHFASSPTASSVTATRPIMGTWAMCQYMRECLKCILISEDCLEKGRLIAGIWKTCLHSLHSNSRRAIRRASFAMISIYTASIAERKLCCCLVGRRIWFPWTSGDMSTTRSCRSVQSSSHWKRMWHPSTRVSTTRIVFSQLKSLLGRQSMDVTSVLRKWRPWTSNRSWVCVFLSSWRNMMMRGFLSTIWAIWRS